MNRRNRKLCLFILVLCLAGVVGLGADGAAAQPLVCDWEGDLYCHDGCRDAYGDKYTGACDTSYGAPTCVCWRWDWS